MKMMRYCKSFCAVWMLYLTCPLAYGAQNSESRFEIVSIHHSAPGGELSFEVTTTGFHAKSTPLFWVVMQAYFPRPLSYWREDRLQNAPAWVMQEPYDIEARVPDSDVQEFKKLTELELARRMRPMLQALLTERCGAVVQTTEAEAVFYALTVSSQGAKMQPAAATPAQTAISLDDGGGIKPLTTPEGRHGFRFTHLSMPMFAQVLSGLGTIGEAPIENRTELKGYFDFVLMKRDAEEAVTPARATEWDLGPLGLELKRTKGVTSALNVRHIERPTAN